MRVPPTALLQLFREQPVAAKAMPARDRTKVVEIRILLLILMASRVQKECLTEEDLD